MYLQSDDYLLPCLNKKLFGVDCPGCGIQRSLVHVAKGEFTDAFYMYPAIYTLLIFAIFLLLNWKLKFKNARKIIIILASINLLIILISYIIKMNQLI